MKIKDFGEGSIWFDNDEKKPVKERLAEGLKQYIKKFGEKPDVIFIGKEGIRKIEGDMSLDGIPIVGDDTALDYNYWYCIKEKRSRIDA